MNFGRLKFSLDDDKIRLNGYQFAEIGIAGRNKISHLGSKLINSSESKTFVYISGKTDKNRLTVVQKNDLIEVVSVFESYSDGNAFSVTHAVKNISDRPITLTNVSFLYNTQALVKDSAELSFTRFLQSHHAECQPRTDTLFHLGLSPLASVSQARIGHLNVGSWSTKEELPQGLLNLYADEKLMFAVESNNTWYYEISDIDGKIYLCLDGGNDSFGDFRKILDSGESCNSETFDLAFGDNLNGVLAAMTNLSRKRKGKCAADEQLPTIFNEYMHFSWDSPSEEITRKAAEKIAQTGVKYYVIDCGWHDEVAGNIIYPYVGTWKESKARFPGGLRKTTDYLRSLGLKAGLWIEPEIVGIKCDTSAFYDDDCFIKRNGERVCVFNRYFLDFRNKKVLAYMNETIRRMVEDYGADYIKLDYNQEMGVGADDATDGFGGGLKKCADAYLGWIDGLRSRFPSVIFETCSSGGMRMDKKTLGHFSIISTSDQVDYKKYPYIAGNILSAVLPEQAAVWSYPVDTTLPAGDEKEKNTAEWVEENIGVGQVVCNMINSFLGRMHLASKLWLLSDEKFALVKEGVKYYDSLTEAKKTATPYLPLGFTDFSEKNIASGFKNGNKIYLAVWRLGGKERLTVPINEEIKRVKVGYPEKLKTEFCYDEKSLTVCLPEEYSAVFFEIELR